MKTIQGNSEVEKQIVLLYSEGVGLKKLAERFGCAPNTIKRTLLRYNVNLRPNVRPKTNLGDEVARLYVEEMMSMYALADKFEISSGHVRDFLVTRGVKIRSPKEAKVAENPKGETASNWKGGRRYTEKGYVLIHCPEHPNATKEGYMMEHRLVMEKKLDRYLTKDEIVHHKNGKKDDNRRSNLAIKIRGQHTKEHFDDVKKVAQLKKSNLRLKKELLAYKKKFGKL